MTPKFAAALSLALIAGAETAKADQTFDLFQTLCVAPNAHMDQALATVDKMGWMPMPQAMLEKLDTELGVKNAQARIVSTAAGMHMLLSFEGDVPLKHLAGRFCFVATYPSDGVSFERQVSDLVKVPSIADAKSDFTIYAWKETPTGHVAVGFDDKDLLDAMATSELHILMERRDKDLAGLILMIPTSVDTRAFGIPSKPQ